MLLANSSCGKQTGTAHARELQEQPRWTLRLTTSGGFAGLGRGNLSVNSEGNVEFQTQDANRVRKGCTTKFSARQLQPISDVVVQTRPELWARLNLRQAAPDAFGYQLELETGASPQSFSIEWYDNTADRLPADLQRLSSVLLKTIDSGCRPMKP